MSRGVKVFGHILAIVITVVIAYYINIYWQLVPWLTSGFVSVLWIYNISIAVTVINHLVQAVFDSGFVRSVGQLVENVFSVALFVTAYYVFPFSINDGTESIVKIALIIIAIVILFGIVAEIAKLITGDHHK